MNYAKEMLRRNRVIAIYIDNVLECTIFFFITDKDNLKTFSNRPMWSTPEDNENGNILFVDKMIAKTWTPTIRKVLEHEITVKFPKIDEAFWLREPNNRSVIIKKRGTNETVYSQIS